MLEALGLGGAGVPGARADPELAVPVAEREVGQARAPGAIRRQKIGRRVAVPAEIGDRAVRQPDPPRARRRLGTRSTTPDRTAVRLYWSGAGSSHTPSVSSTGCGSDRQATTLPGASPASRLHSPSARAGVVVAGQQQPAHVRGGLHARQRLAIDAIAGPSELSNTSPATRTPCVRPPHAAPPRPGCRSPSSRASCRRRARLVGQAAERLAELQVGGVQEADHAASPAAARRRPAARRGC